MSWHLYLYTTGYATGAVDLLPDVLGPIQCQRGSSVEGLPFGGDASSVLSCTLREATKYSIFKATSARYGQLKPGRRIALVETVGTVTTSFWGGHLQRVTYHDAAGVKRAQLHAVGAVTWYSRPGFFIVVDPDTSAISPAEVTAGVMAGVVLDLLPTPYGGQGIPASLRSVDAGARNIATSYALSTGLFGLPLKSAAPMQALRLLCQTEGGRLYEDRAGKMVFRSRSGVAADQTQTPIATLTDWRDLRAEDENARLYNEVRMSIAGGDFFSPVDVYTASGGKLSVTLDTAGDDYPGGNEDPSYTHYPYRTGSTTFTATKSGAELSQWGHEYTQTEAHFTGGGQSYSALGTYTRLAQNEDDENTLEYYPGPITSPIVTVSFASLTDTSASVTVTVKAYASYKSTTVYAQCNSVDLKGFKVTASDKLQTSALSQAPSDAPSQGDYGRIALEVPRLLM